MLGLAFERDSIFSQMNTHKSGGSITRHIGKMISF